MVPVGDGLLLGLLVAHLAVRPEADMAVRVHEARQHPALEGLDLRAGVGGVRDPSLRSPRSRPRRLLGPDEHLTADMKHRRIHRLTLPIRRCPLLDTHQVRLPHDAPQTRHLTCD